MPLTRVEPERYADLLAAKAATTCELLAPVGFRKPQLFPSPPTAYRARAEFRLWHDGDALDYAMFAPESPREPVVIEHFPVAIAPIQRLMPELLQRLRANPVLRRKLFQCEFLSTLAGDTVVTLAYHRQLEDEWEIAAGALATALSVSIVGRARKQKRVVGNDFVEEVLPVAGRDYHFRQYEQAFSQPNPAVNQAMQEWALAGAAGLDGDLLELYCGNGNFSLPMASVFPQVIATELSKTGVRAARHNACANGVNNLQLIRLSAAEVVQAVRGDREFRRLADLPKPLNEYDLRTVLVDPPRAGLDADTLAMLPMFDNVFYISCNPVTLAGNLAVLAEHFRITRCALFDQFPYTPHMECGVQLQRISNS